jgi:HD-GYP domain-containing protein (c-di-GMP phosphodiesterase class II)
MEENIGTLVRLPIRYLHRGLTLTSPMFSWDSERMLLPTSSILTNERIKRLIKHNNGRDFVMVDTDIYTKVVGHKFGDAFKHAELVKESVGYQGWSVVTSKVLDKVNNVKKIDKKDIEEIATDLCDKLALTDAKSIVTIINSLNHVDQYLESHCINVGLLNGLIGQWFNLPKKAIDRLVLIGFLHDCGKTRIEKEVLIAPRKLTPEEFLLVQRHPIESYNLLGDYPLDIRRAVKAHHEKLDGTGYPDNLLTDQISH